MLAFPGPPRFPFALELSPMKVARLFTSDRAQPFEGIEFEDRSSRIGYPKLSVVF